MLRPVAWVCGPEPVLKAEVVRAYRDAVPSVTLLFAGELPEYQVWDQLLSMPLPGGRLIVVHDAEKLKDHAKFAVLAGAEGMETAFTVFISAEKDFASVEDTAGKKTAAPHLAALKAARRAQLVRCARPSREEDLLRLVSSWWPGAGSNHAHALLTRCGGDLAAAREACLKAELTGLAPGAENIEHVIGGEPAHDFADSLVAGDCRSAALAAGALGSRELGYALQVLGTQLGQLAALCEARARGLTAAEIAGKLRMDRYAQHRLSPHAGQYGPEKVRACRRLLAEAETAWRSGASTGVAEAVAALW